MKKILTTIFALAMTASVSIAADTAEYQASKRKDFSDKTIITPLPVYIIATYDENGVPNAMNAAWGGQVGLKQIAFNLSPHKTTENLKLKKAFTVSYANKENVVIADYFGVETGHKLNKIEKVGMHAIKSKFVDAPIIDEFPLTIECKVVEMEMTPYNELRVVGEIVNLSAKESILDEKGNVDLGKLQPIMYDSSANLYRVIGEPVGKAFNDGLKIRDQK